MLGTTCFSARTRFSAAREQLHRGQTCDGGGSFPARHKQQPRAGPGGPEGSRGGSNPRCSPATETDGLRESHRQPGLPVWLAALGLPRAEESWLALPPPAPHRLARANDSSAPVQVTGSVSTGMLTKTWHVKTKTTRTNHSCLWGVQDGTDPAHGSAPPPRPAQGAHSFFTLMEEELEVNSLCFLCSKRETGNKKKKPQAKWEGALRSQGKHNCLSQSRPRGSGITFGSAQWTTLPPAQPKAQPGPCMMGGTELIQQ